MRTYDEAFVAARDGSPFSNGTEGMAWMDQWCGRCAHDKGTRDGSDPVGCPLVMVALMGKTPSEWLEQDHSQGWSLTDAYHCVEFRSEDDPGPGEDGPRPPEPPMPGQEVLFDVQPHTRMYADVVRQEVPA